jgi:hypothetical protein
VKPPAQFGQALALKQWLCLDGRPCLFEQVAQLKAARTINVIGQTGL